jgi:hypothetical protein
MGIGDSGIGGNCTRTAEACGELRARLSQIAGGIDQCRRVSDATCFAYQQDGEDRESCWIDQNHCRSLRRDVSRKRKATAITACTDL